MVWCKVLKVKEYDDKSYIVEFRFFDKIKQTIVTDKVLKYCKVEKIGVNDNVFISKMFNDKPPYNQYYLIRQVKGV